jgi:hypothetical protein
LFTEVYGTLAVEYTATHGMANVAEHHCSPNGTRDSILRVQLVIIETNNAHKENVSIAEERARDDQAYVLQLDVHLSSLIGQTSLR